MKNLKFHPKFSRAEVAQRQGGFVHDLADKLKRLQCVYCKCYDSKYIYMGIA